MRTGAGAILVLASGLLALFSLFTPWFSVDFFLTDRRVIALLRMPAAWVMGPMLAISLIILVRYWTPTPRIDRRLLRLFLASFGLGVANTLLFVVIGSDFRFELGFAAAILGHGGAIAGVIIRLREGQHLEAGRVLFVR